MELGGSASQKTAVYFTSRILGNLEDDMHSLFGTESSYFTCKCILHANVNF